MSSAVPFHEGMQVYGSDGELVGTVVAVGAPGAVPSLEIDCFGGACRVPTTAIARVEQDKAYLPNPAAQYRSQPHARAERAWEPGSAESEPI